MKKLLTIILVFGLVLSSLFAGYSISLDTSISSISGGEYGFGMGMFPLGTAYTFNKSFQMIPNYKHKAYFEFYSRFSFTNKWFGSYELFSGEPYWNTRYIDRVRDMETENWYSGYYFNPNSTLEFFIQQPFGTNPITETGQLVIIRAGLSTRYSIALERLNMSRGDTGATFINDDGSYKEPFGPNSEIMAFPWLQDNRKSLNNYIFISTFWYFYESTAFSASDGVYIDLTLEYGPSWLGNNFVQSSPSSNFFKPSLYIDESLTLYSKKQENGLNWLSIYIGHSNTLNYTFGDIIPENKLPGDRLRGYFNDSIWMHFTGPQIFAGDFYPYIELRLSNNFYFGTVANEATQQIKAIEHQSDLSMVFHLRFFGFIHFEYSCGYSMARGIWSYNPAWRQSAAISFYVSI